MLNTRARLAQCRQYMVIAAAAVFVAAPLAAQNRSRDRNRDNDSRPNESRSNDFNWSGSIASGNSIIIRNINGPVRVERSNNGRVEVSAEKRWRRGNPDDVRIVQPGTNTGNVVICALWTEDSSCDERGIHTPRNSGRNNNNNDVSVHFVVRVPNRVRVNLETVNGGIEVEGGDNEIRANTVNGSVVAHGASGPVYARTVNGSITVGMNNVRSSDDLDYETVNGSVTLELPANFGAQLELSTVNGRVSTDFPVTVTGTMSPRRLRGTVGNGESRVRASTVNGSINLVRSGN
ncbi:MAG: DUF4097 family beta strand repeat-containing protein [Gemmatimonas sp.]